MMRQFPFIMSITILITTQVIKLVHNTYEQLLGFIYACIQLLYEWALSQIIIVIE